MSDRDYNINVDLHTILKFDEENDILLKLKTMQKSENTKWCLLTLTGDLQNEKDLVIKFEEEGDDFDELIDELSSRIDEVCWVYTKIKPENVTEKFVLLVWCHKSFQWNRNCEKILREADIGYSLKIEINDEDSLDEDEIKKKVKVAAGSTGYF